MAKKDDGNGPYIVRHNGVGTKGQGEWVAPGDPGLDDWQWDRLVGLGAISPPTEEEQDAATAAGKQAQVGADSPALTTGQPGGAPLPSQASMIPSPSGEGAPTPVTPAAGVAADVTGQPGGAPPKASK